MSVTIPPANVFVSYTAAVRKPLLVSFGMFGPEDNLSFIYSIGIGSGGSPTPLTGTIDGVNAIFLLATAPLNGALIFKNGIAQDPAASYALINSTVTFTAANIPQIGDDLYAVVF